MDFAGCHAGASLEHAPETNLCMPLQVPGETTKQHSTAYETTKLEYQGKYWKKRLHLEVSFVTLHYATPPLIVGPAKSRTSDPQSRLGAHGEYLSICDYKTHTGIPSTVVFRVFIRALMS
jgi:hypothetical protein